MTASHRPKKNLGQNFLTDPRARQRIVEACELTGADTVVEIGPGRGAITRLMAPCVKKLICIETDRDLIEPLRSELAPLSTEIIHADFLKWDLGILPGPVKVVGNIPYYLSTPIIEKLIENRAKVTQAYLTVQLEFGQRLTAAAGGRDYGSLSCFAQYYADIKMLFKIKNTCFKPAPQVDSCFIRMTMRPPVEAAGFSEEKLFKMIQTAFQQRRKTIVNALKGFVDKGTLEASLTGLNLSLAARPETLTLSNYIELCKRVML